MDRDEIRRLLTELGRRLAERGAVGEVYLVGGAAIALVLDARRSTRNIDAVFEPKALIYGSRKRCRTISGFPPDGSTMR